MNHALKILLRQFKTQVCLIHRYNENINYHLPIHQCTIPRVRTYLYSLEPTMGACSNCDYEQGPCFIPLGHTRNKLHKPKPVQLKSRKWIWKKIKVNRPGRRKLGQGRNSWQWAKHAWLYSDLPQALKGKISSALGSQQKGGP